MEEVQALATGDKVFSVNNTIENISNHEKNLEKEKSNQSGAKAYFPKSKRKVDKSKEDKKKKIVEDLQIVHVVEPTNEFDIYIRELSRFRSKEIAVKYLLDNKLTVTKLKMLAKKLSIYIKSKSKKIDIIEAIVEGIVGSRLKLEALREY